MNTRKANRVSVGVAEASAPGAPGSVPTVARVVDVPDAGGVEIELAGGVRRRARAVAGLVPGDRSRIVGREVLVVFDQGSPDAPVAVALMQSPLEAAGVTTEAPAGAIDARIDGERVVIQANTRLELRCGKASIVIDREGKITIKGAHLLHRSTGPIRIKGGHVDIN